MECHWFVLNTALLDGARRWEGWRARLPTGTFLWMTDGATVAKGVILTFWTELFVRIFKDVIG